MTSYLEITEFKNSPLLKEEGVNKAIPDKFKKIKVKPVTTYHVVIENDEDFFNVLESLRYHMIDEIPFEVYDYFVHHPELDLKGFKDYHHKEFEILRNQVNYEVDEKNRYTYYKYKGRKIKNVYDKIRGYSYDGTDDVSLSFIKYLVEKVHVRFNQMVLESIAEDTNDKLDIIKYLFDRGYSLNGVIWCENTHYNQEQEWNVADVCSFKEKLEYLEFALENGCPVTNLDIIYENDDVEMLKYIIDKGFDTKGYIKYTNRKNRHSGFTFELIICYYVCGKCMKYFIDNGFIEKDKMIAAIEKVVKDNMYGDNREEENKKLKQIAKMLNE